MRLLAQYNAKPSMPPVTNVTPTKDRARRIYLGSVRKPPMNGSDPIAALAANSIVDAMYGVDKIRLTRIRRIAV